MKRLYLTALCLLASSSGSTAVIEHEFNKEFVRDTDGIIIEQDLLDNMSDLVLAFKV